MKKGLRYLWILEILLMVLFAAGPALAAERATIRELNRHPQNYAERSVILVGEIGTVLDRIDSGLYVTNLDHPQSQLTSTNTRINLYRVTDAIESIYVVTTGYFQEKERIELSVQVLITATQEPDQKRVNLFDQHISKKLGVSSLGYSRFTLQSLLKKLPQNNFWVLAVEVE